MTTWVLLRGLAREARHWGDFPAALQERTGASRVVALDLPGSGLRGAERSPITVEAMVAECRRALVRAGAPGPSQFSNRFSNWWVSRFAGQELSDTQCGLRRYPLQATLALDCDARGYGFECDMLVRAARRGIPIVEVPVTVIYPPKAERVSHFHVVADPARIVVRLLHTAFTVKRTAKGP